MAEQIRDPQVRKGLLFGGKAGDLSGICINFRKSPQVPCSDACGCKGDCGYGELPEFADYNSIHSKNPARYGPAVSGVDAGFKLKAPIPENMTELTEEMEFAHPDDNADPYATAA